MYKECMIISVGVPDNGVYLSIIQVLLQRGYYVRTTVRSAAKAEFLKSLPHATERLRIYDNVDLLTPGAFDEAMNGCSAVLHTASPFFFSGGSEDSLVVPAVTGTRNVLDSCRKLNVQKVVLTASTACVYVDYGTVPDDHVYTDKDWSQEPLLREKESWYPLSKTAAERLAWEMSSEEGCPYKLSVMNPTLILGPQLPGQPHLNTSSNAVAVYIDGSMKEIPNACKSIVDVRDVAEAHVAALDREDAFGRRFLLIGASPHSRDIAAAARNALPESMQDKVPTKLGESFPPQVMGPRPPLPVLYDASPSEQILGITYKSVEEMVGSSVKSLLDNGLSSSALYSIDKL